MENSHLLVETMPNGDKIVRAAGTFKHCVKYAVENRDFCIIRADDANLFGCKKYEFIKHVFVTPQNVEKPDDRWCAECGLYFTHPIHVRNENK